MFAQITRYGRVRTRGVGAWEASRSAAILPDWRLRSCRVTAGFGP